MRIGDAVTVCIGFLVAAVAGCAGRTVSQSTQPGGDGEGAAGSADATIGSANDTGGGSGGTTGWGGAPDATTNGTTGGCSTGIPATSQVPRLLNREYDAIVHDVLGISTLAGAGDNPPSSLLNDDYEGEMNAYAWRAYQAAANEIAADVMAGDNRSRFMSCDPTTDDACYEDTIRSFGRRMFRRPLGEDEVTRFMTFTEADPDWTPEEISEAILYAFLVSPSFIMVPELNAQAEGDAFRLSSHEVATRLSLMLWGSVGDAELDNAADQDLLATPEQIRAQAERMIQNREKAAPQVSAAHRDYIGSSDASSHWWKVDHDPIVFPDYTDLSRIALQGEVDVFFAELAYSGRSFQDIFLSNIAFVNQDSAAIYGLDATDYGADLTRVELDATERPGIFTRAGFLSSYSSFNATSPILRGSFLSVSVLGVDPGSLDLHPNNPSGPYVEYATRREQIEAITSAPECAPCHDILDAPGFVMENYDAVGGWQTTDQLGGAIDSTAEVAFADGARTISSPLELMEAIADDPRARHLYAEKLVSFFTRREQNPGDACLVDDIATKLAADGYGMLDLIVELTQADSFRLRVAEN